MSIKINNSVNLYFNIVKCKEQGLTGGFKEIREDDGKSDKKRIGFATVKGETKGKLYIMTAHYGEKFTVDNKTETQMTALSQAERVPALARLLGGSEITELALANAQEMLDLVH